MLREIMRRSEWILVGGKWTRISVMGTDISSETTELSNKGDSDNRIVILMIPGNPGNELFYADFGRRVIRCLLSREERLGNKKQQYLFYTVSHLNHVTMPIDLRDTGGHNHDARFKLDEQVQHKLDFIKEHLPRGHKVYIFGHSIGSYMMLKVLPYIKDDFNIRKVVGLYPTVERMATSPNGVRLRRLLATLDTNDWLTKTLSFWLDYLPYNWKYWLANFHLTGQHVPPEVIEAASELLSKNVFRNIVHMSHDELNTVIHFDSQLIAFPENIYFYYGTEDGWCPLTYGLEMQDRMPKSHVIIDDKNCEHAFVIKDGAVMSEKLLQFIN